MSAIGRHFFVRLLFFRLLSHEIREINFPMTAKLKKYFFLTNSVLQYFTAAFPINVVVDYMEQIKENQVVGNQ